MNKQYERKIRYVIEKFDTVSQAKIENDIAILIEKGGDSIESVLFLLQNKEVDISIRKIACWFVGQLEDERAVEPLMRIFQDESDDEIIWECAKSLGILGSRTLFLPFCNILCNDHIITRRAAAAYFLGHLHDERAIDVLLKILCNCDEHPTVRGHAAEALGLLGNQCAVPHLIATLKDSSPNVRFWSTYALGELGDTAALPYLEYLAETDTATIPGWWSIRKEAREAIIRLQQKLK